MARIKSLADLKQLKHAIEAQARQQAERAAEQAQATRRTQSEKNLFLKAIGSVNPLPAQRRATPPKKPPPPVPMQHPLAAPALVLEALSDEFDASALLDTDADLSYARPGIGPDVPRKLRQGHWRIQRQLDLHGLRTEAARQALGQFIREAHQHGIRCLRIIYGKGLSSPGKTPVLQSRVHSWLVQKKEVLAFVQAQPADGGSGALVVLLQPSPSPSP